MLWPVRTCNFCIPRCPSHNAVVEPECEKSSATTYFWYRQTLNTTSTIAESGGLNVKMTLSLLAAWIIVCLAVIKGIASSGKVGQNRRVSDIVMLQHTGCVLYVSQVMYFSSLFPYVVLFCFLVRGLMLKGSVDGIAHMFTPKVSCGNSFKCWLGQKIFLSHMAPPPQKKTNLHAQQSPRYTQKTALTLTKKPHIHQEHRCIHKKLHTHTEITRTHTQKKTHIQQNDIHIHPPPQKKHYSIIYLNV